jgi:hypothetical protein
VGVFFFFHFLKMTRKVCAGRGGNIIKRFLFVSSSREGKDGAEDVEMVGSGG